MPFHVACPTCKNVMAVPEGSSGQQVACPSCQHAMTVPPMPPPAMARAKPVTPPQSTRKLRDEEPPRRTRRDDWDDKPEPRRRRLKLYQPSRQAYIVGVAAVVVQIAIGAAFIVLNVGVKYMAAMEARPEIGNRRGTTPTSASTTPTSRLSDDFFRRDPFPVPRGWAKTRVAESRVTVASPGPLTASGGMFTANEGVERNFYTFREVPSDFVYGVMIERRIRQAAATAPTAQPPLEAFFDRLYPNERLGRATNSTAAVGTTRFVVSILRKASQTMYAQVYGNDNYKVTAFVLVPAQTSASDPRLLGFLDNVELMQ